MTPYDSRAQRRPSHKTKGLSGTQKAIIGILALMDFLVVLCGLGLVANATADIPLPPTLVLPPPPTPTFIQLPTLIPTQAPTPKLPTSTFLPQPTSSQPTVTPSSTPTPLPTSTASAFEIVRFTDVAYVNGYAELLIRTLPGTICHLTYITPNGTESQAKGLGATTADENGYCRWYWKIGSKTRPGIGTLTITANGKTQALNIKIVE